MCSRRFSRFASPPGQVTRHVFAGPSRRMFRVEWRCTKDAAFSDAAPRTRLYEGGSTSCRAVLHVGGYRLILTVRSAPRLDLTLVAGSMSYLPREICARQPERESQPCRTRCRSMCRRLPRSFGRAASSRFSWPPSVSSPSAGACSTPVLDGATTRI